MRADMGILILLRGVLGFRLSLGDVNCGVLLKRYWSYWLRC
jgi:hypothetical protein